MELPLVPPLVPMLARLARRLPEGDDLVYEPKWDGFRCLAFRSGGDVDLRSRNDRPLARYFPEIVEALRQLGTGRVVLDGELVVVRGERFDFDAVLLRLHPAASRVARLAAETPASFVAFDVIAVGDEDLTDAPFAVRRRRLEEVLAGSPSPLLLTPATDDPALARRWLASFTGGGIDGVVAKAAGSPYQPGVRAMTKVKRERTADCVVAGFRVFREPPAVASLLLGLHDRDGVLRHIGVVSSFAERRRRELLQELVPWITDLTGHPWEHGFGLEGPVGRLKGAASRWTPEQPRDWVPVRPELVCEVAYETVEHGRLRYPARFRTWRPDRDAASCTFDQLDEAGGDAPARLLEGL